MTLPFTTCTIAVDSGRFCDAEVPADAPISACRRHMASAYLYMENLLAIANTQRDYGMSPAERVRVIQANQLPQPEPRVYYILFGDRVKIGTTNNMEARMANLPHDKILGWEPGGSDVERKRQDQFRLSRIHGEWFGATDELLRHAESCRRQYGSYR
jgi:hypothetical protein